MHILDESPLAFFYWLARVSLTLGNDIVSLLKILKFITKMTLNDNCHRQS